MTKKVLRVTYTASHVFLIPDDIDLENKEQVEGYKVKYNMLQIVKTDGTEIEIKSERWVEKDNDYKQLNKEESDFKQQFEYEKFLYQKNKYSYNWIEEHKFTTILILLLIFLYDILYDNNINIVVGKLKEMKW